MKRLIAILALLAILGIVLFALLPQTDPQVRAVRQQEAIARSRDITWFLRGLMVLLTIYGAIGARWMWNRAHHIHAHSATGLFPATPSHWNYGHLNSDRAHVASALATGGRISAPVARQLVADPDPLALPPPAPLQLTAGEAVNVDPVTRPHWLIVGQTGSGKSTATRYIMGELTRRYPCEFAICEPGGVDWNTSVAAHTENGIASAIEAVHGEFMRRQESLRSADVQYFTNLPEHLPYLYIVCEEMDSMFDNLRHVDRGRAIEARGQLRDLVRMGRKTGVCLIAVATSATADIFDPHLRKNMANVLLFRNTQQVAYAFGVDTNLTTLPTGTAYSVTHERMVNFPRMERPVVPLSRVYREDGQQPLQPLQPFEEGQFSPVVEPQPPVATVVHIERGRMPTAEQAAEMRRMREHGMSKTLICLQCWNYKDGDVWKFLDMALRGEI